MRRAGWNWGAWGWGDARWLGGAWDGVGQGKMWLPGIGWGRVKWRCLGEDGAG